MSKTIRVNLTLDQIRVISTAINAEINKGAGTFLSDRDVKDLSDSLDSLISAKNMSRAGLMSRIDETVAEYMAQFNYSNYYQLTVEDIEYIAQELQLNPGALAELLGISDDDLV